VNDTFNGDIVNNTQSSNWVQLTIETSPNVHKKSQRQNWYWVVDSLLFWHLKQKCTNIETWHSSSLKFSILTFTSFEQFHSSTNKNFRSILFRYYFIYIFEYFSSTFCRLCAFELELNCNWWIQRYEAKVFCNYSNSMYSARIEDRDPQFWHSIKQILLNHKSNRKV